MRFPRFQYRLWVIFAVVAAAGYLCLWLTVFRTENDIEQKAPMQKDHGDQRRPGESWKDLHDRKSEENYRKWNP